MWEHCYDQDMHQVGLMALGSCRVRPWGQALVLGCTSECTVGTTLPLEGIGVSVMVPSTVISYGDVPTREGMRLAEQETTCNNYIDTVDTADG